MSWSRGVLVRVGGLVLVVGAVVALVVVGVKLAGRSDAQEYRHGDDSSTGEEVAIPVKVVQPRVDPNFKISVTQPAYVTSYYPSAELRAQVGGMVRRVTKAIGDKVKAGEPLIQVNVPDLVADVGKKSAVVGQRQRELEVAHAMLARAEALVKVATATIKEKKAEVDIADATTTFRKQEVGRFRGMAREKAILGDVVAERQKFYEAAKAASAKARASVERAQADELEAAAKLQEAIADEKLKEQMIDVARKDLEQAQAMLGYATVTAPYDGVVTRRNVDPGSFVQNSSSSPGASLMTVEKTDLLTVYTNIPDNYAPYVDEHTEATLELSELPGTEIQARVTRYSPSLQTPSNDRTMRVEVDLYNRGQKSWKTFLEKVKAGTVDLKGGKLPVLPQISGNENGLSTGLLPGMYGTMKLDLRNFKQARLLPSSAVFSKGGKPYIFVVQKGVAHLVPVEVQVDDGILAKVTLLLPGPKGQGQRRGELRGDEQVVLSNQAELSDGQQVNASQVSW